MRSSISVLPPVIFPLLALTSAGIRPDTGTVGAHTEGNRLIMESCFGSGVTIGFDGKNLLGNGTATAASGFHSSMAPGLSGLLLDISVTEIRIGLTPPLSFPCIIIPSMTTPMHIECTVPDGIGANLPIYVIVNKNSTLERISPASYFLVTYPAPIILPNTLRFATGPPSPVISSSTTTGDAIEFDVQVCKIVWMSDPLLLTPASSHHALCTYSPSLITSLSCCRVQNFLPASLLRPEYLSAVTVCYGSVISSSCQYTCQVSLASSSPTTVACTTDSGQGTDFRFWVTVGGQTDVGTDLYRSASCFHALCLSGSLPAHRCFFSTRLSHPFSFSSVCHLHDTSIHASVFLDSNQCTMQLCKCSHCSHCERLPHG